MPGFSLLLTGSHGLGDNPEASYRELLDLGEQGKGFFAAAEIYWASARAGLRVGAWNNSADHARLGSASGGNRAHDDNYGIYASLDGTIDAATLIRWNLRVGAANPKVSEAAHFASLAAEYPRGALTLAVGAARTWASDQLTGLKNSDFFEVNARYAVSDALRVTALAQRLRHIDFGGDSDTVAGLRLAYEF